MAGETLTNILSLFYIIPTYILYFMIIYIMFWNAGAKMKFNFCSFYKLFGYSAINYIIQSFFYYAVLRFPYISFIFSFVKNCPQSNWIYPVSYAFMYYSATALHLYSLALSFNRLTVFILKESYTDFWKKWLKYILTFCILFPFLFIWHFPFIRVECSFRENYGALIYPRNPSAIPWMLNSQILFIEILITSSLSLGMNMYVIFHLLKRKYYTRNKISRTTTTNKILSNDIKMLIYSMLIFFTEVCSCVQQLLLTFWPETFQSFVNSTQLYLADISTLLPAWFILAMNKQLRNEIMILFNIKKSCCKTVKVTVIANTASTMTMTAIV